MSDERLILDVFDLLTSLVFHKANTIVKQIKKNTPKFLKARSNQIKFFMTHKNYFVGH